MSNNNERGSGLAEIEVMENGLVSGLFCWDERDGDFRNVRVEELREVLDADAGR